MKLFPCVFKKISWLLFFAFASLFLTPLVAQSQNPPPKCEKCYRGLDGKIKCDPVPCPPKK